MPTIQDIATIALIGTGATVLMDAWLFILARLGLPASNIQLIGRWVGHMGAGRFTHASIARSQPIAGERALGWLAHYAIGIAYAGALVGLVGLDWASHPTLLPAVLFGVATVAAPFFLMQPAMGAGFAASKTPTPIRNCLRSIANHAVFGAGLYLTAVAIARLSS